MRLVWQHLSGINGHSLISRCGDLRMRVNLRLRRLATSFVPIIASWVHKYKSRKIQRYRLRQWLELEEIHTQVQQAVDVQDVEKLADGLIAYISTAVGKRWLEHLPWQLVVSLYAQIVSANLPDQKFPLLRAKGKDEKVSWDYLGRSWYAWLHIFAKEYGWSREYIATLDIDETLALFQEILVQDQLEKEFAWGMSEIAYAYDPNTKSSKFNQLERPVWMRPDPVKDYMKRKQKLKPIPQILMPVGSTPLDAKS